MVAFAALLASASATASAAPIILDGDVPEGGPDHFFVPFEVPAGTVEIEVKHDDLSEKNILDWGLDDATGFRGWGGGNSEPAVVGVDAASRSYVPGPIAPGTWKVVVGKAKILEKPAKYHLEIDLRTTPTLAKQIRKPYVAPVLESTARWYAGDFHVHSRESGDATATFEQITTFAKSVGLDFVEISDHNVVTQTDFFADAQANSKVLLVPGIEYTTYAGHANAIGSTKWLDHRIGLSGTIDAAIQATHQQGGLFAINHPMLDLGNECIGCAWKHELSERIDAIEIETGGYEPVGFLFFNLAIGFWEKELAKGAHVAAIGGSDDHRGGAPASGTQSPIASPTTMVFARELSAAAIFEGIKNGRTVVKLQSPADPMVEMTTDVTPAGDTVADTYVAIKLRVTGAKGQAVRLVKNGTRLDEIDVTNDAFETTAIFDAPKTGEDRYRAEVVVDGKPRTVTSHVFVKYAATGRTKPLPADASEADSKGCGCGVATTQSGIGLAALALALAYLRRRSR